MSATARASTAATPRATATMRAAVLAGPRQFAVQQVALPEPGPGQVRVRLRGCGVCASNLPVWQGRPWFEYPLAPGAPGHEGWGLIDAVGEGVDQLQPGQAVAVLSYHAFTEYDVADAQQVVPLPEALRDKPLPGEPLGCAVNVLRRSGIEAGQSVAIIGIGFLGALLVQLAAETGANVVAISRRPTALALAQQCGAQHVVALDEPGDVMNQVAAALGTAELPVVIEAVGVQDTLDLASQLVAVRGRLVIAGYHQDGPRTVDMQQWNWRGIDVINAHERDPAVYMAGIAAAVELVAQGKLNIDPLLTHPFRMDEINQALAVADERPDGFMKAYVTY